MKKIIFLLTVLFYTASVFALDNPWEKNLPFEHAIIDYKISGTMNGEKTTYVKDYGRTTAEYSNMSIKMFGMTQETKDVAITTPDWVYNIDLVQNTGTKQANPTKFLIQDFNKLSKDQQEKVIENAQKPGISTIAGMDGKLQKNATTILGYQCDKIDLAGYVSAQRHCTGVEN